MRFQVLTKLIRPPLAWIGFFCLTIPYVICGMIEFLCNIVLESCEAYERWAFKENDE